MFSSLSVFLKGLLSSPQTDSHGVAGWELSALFRCFITCGKKYCLPNRRWDEAEALPSHHMLWNLLNTP